MCFKEFLSSVDRGCFLLWFSIYWKNSLRNIKKEVKASSKIIRTILRKFYFTCKFLNFI